MILVGKPHQTLPPKVCNCGIASMVTANHDSGCALRISCGSSEDTSPQCAPDDFTPAAMPEFEKATPTEQPTTFDKKREITWKLWRDGYGEYYVRPQDAWDAGWRYAEMELRREIAQLQKLNATIAEALRLSTELHLCALDDGQSRVYVSNSGRIASVSDRTDLRNDPEAFGRSSAAKDLDQLKKYKEKI